MKYLITGITGLIGQELAFQLMKDGHEVYGITRQKSVSFLPKENVYSLDLEKSVPSEYVKGFDVIVHLAGYPVAENHWSAKVKSQIKSSRVLATKNLVQAINSLPTEDKPKFFVAGSAVGIYGKGFLADVTREWEEQSLKIKDVPYAVIRTGIVLSRYGGALSAMPPVVVGNGKMVMSWIHIEDWVKACRFVIDKKLKGTFNFTAPEPRKQSKFVKALAKAKKYPFCLWAPLTILKIALGERASVLFESIDVKPDELLKAGYQFHFPKLQPALEDLYKDEKITDQVLWTTQFIPDDINPVFDFFSDAKNLEKITPPFLNFKIRDMNTESVEKGSLIRYRLKIHGIPVGWKTLISEWIPQSRFVDEQLSGPYKKWHHTHDFIQIKGGTLITDRVVYRLPFGILGLVALPMVKKDVSSIFKFRKQVIAETFKS